ncbi:MAG: type I-E CRISPR-associated protein Cas6/Cse3/CasE [Deltaproteobacteria bacterium]|jgi:CRISPR system Cascade subunit CasE|nr:type I-E CRISPR-associated protein Cas6/Cse3/CasE [Deltaproteobacteria bacterium]MDD3620629.1 type I-E CRISPR-associated protein Cas6/Cse3/CasE [Desulfobulbaceae bacterium]
MYLSKVMISGAACRNPYEIHRALWKLFPTDADAARDFLFRVERSGQRDSEILMQSLREPLGADAPINEARLLGSKQYTLSLTQGQNLRFKLLANPVKTINDEGGRLTTKGEVKKCRVPLVRDEELEVWLIRKLAGIAEIKTVEVEKRLPLNFRKASEKRIGKVQPVCFQGTLAVTDPASLEELVQKGIGPGKAFGCGLLSLAK